MNSFFLIANSFCLTLNLKPVILKSTLKPVRDQLLLGGSMNTSLNEKNHAVNKVFEAVFDGKMPSRVPILTNIDNAFCLEYAGYSLKKEQYSIEKTLEAIDVTTRGSRHYHPSSTAL